jgi:drug/metabolite transporter (DMT)-like permease
MLSILLFLVGVGLVTLANKLGYLILDEVNASNPPDQQISRFGVSTKLGLVLRRHREAFPNSGKRWLLLVLFVAGFASGVAGALMAYFRYPAGGAS